MNGFTIGKAIVSTPVASTPATSTPVAKPDAINRAVAISAVGASISAAEPDVIEPALTVSASGTSTPAEAVFRQDSTTAAYVVNVFEGDFSLVEAAGGTEAAYQGLPYIEQGFWSELSGAPEAATTTPDASPTIEEDEIIRQKRKK